ncbi:hypothetical protein [Comamonas sp. MYb396]|uniref:hypothetical protein n=1 Tax=Comamonas sp. MYb396 TaxID=2745302 RepID=UPI0030AE932E
MSVTLYVERPRNEPAIELNEWLSVIKADTQLQMRTAPYKVINPTTGATIEMSVGEADSEIYFDGEWVPFLQFRRGKLRTGYVEEFDNPSDLRRQKISAIAKALDAQIATDDDDDLLDW